MKVLQGKNLASNKQATNQKDLSSQKNEEFIHLRIRAHLRGEKVTDIAV